jgi:signal transduction histidine kinase
MGLAHGLRLLADGGSQESLEPALTLYEKYAARTSFAAPYHQGISARLLALLCVERWLPPSERDSELAALRSAVESHGVALPVPVGDGIRWAGQTPELEQDPWWSALEEAARRRLLGSGGVWDALFDHEARLGLAFTKGWGIDRVSGGPLGRWAIVPLEEHKVWVAHRRTADGGLRTSVHTAAQLDGALNGLVASGSEDGAKTRDGFVVQAFGDSGPSSALIEPLSLEGTTASLWVHQSDVDGYMAPMTRRFQALRIGLLLTALLIVAASAFAWFAMKRGERLRSLRSTFVASVSHDLRTPVAAIGLLAENMAHGYHQGAEDHYVESLQSETARLRRLVDDLLDFGRIEGGLPPQVRRVPVMVSSWIAGFVERERKRCHPLGCALDLVVEGLPESAYLDPAAMERALANLIDNAVKHGGAQSVELRARGADGDLIFEIIDAGSGLSSAALRADLFLPFERGGVQSTGTGLGLSIVEKIALAHGGRATLGPHAGGGAIASVSVALENEESA